ncbi:MAG: PBP1A family penicillin-binding protein [Coriobacteriales bacterium]|jgi:penicillin-binding protein 1A|nr:PBP1A family penicillin-binding protein [Coriobacteriales bacterium]
MSSRKKRATVTPKKHILPFVAVLFLVVVIGLFGFGTLGAYALVQSWLTDLPDIEDADAFNVARKTHVWDSSGTVLLGEFYAEDREPVTADQVSPYVFNATIAIEDERFWEHNGVDYQSIARALVVDLSGGATQGASTITQQFVRQTLLKSEANVMTIERKVREAYLAQELEERYTKEEVLMMYLNTINYGDGSWGIQSAAKHYFGKSAAELTVPEAALICGIPQSPEYNNPVTYPDNALTRRNLVLDAMAKNGYITEAEAEEFKATDLGLNVQDRTNDGIYEAPYFTSYVRQVLLEDDNFSYDEVFKGGLEVYTTINLDYQAVAEEACAAKEATLDSDVQVGLCCVDPHTGYILAMRGGKDYDVQSWNSATQMFRQPGSCFKMFALVAALEQGYSPNTSVSGASPLTFDGWRVENYGGASYGTLNLYSATSESSNTAYARIVRKIGASSVYETAIKMGIVDDGVPYKMEVVPSIVLGSQGVNTLEMASAFGTLANDGVHVEPTPITKIVNHKGEIIYEHVVEGEQVISPEVAYAATRVLRGVVTGGTGTLAYLGYQDCAGKTGTSENWRDSWFCGYTPQLSTAVWIGADPERYLADNVGGSNCCPVWKTFMNYALQDYAVADFNVYADPPYDPKATFMTQAEKDAADAAAAKEAEEKEKAEEEARLKATDSDGDGYSDWDEQQAGTNPNDPSSYPGAPPPTPNCSGACGCSGGGACGMPSCTCLPPPTPCGCGCSEPVVGSGSCAVSAGSGGCGCTP